MKAAPRSGFHNLTRLKLGLQRITNRRRRRGLRRRPILFDFLALDLLDSRAVAQADSPRLGTDLYDFEIVLLARLERSRALQRTSRRAVAAHSFVAPASVFDFSVVAKRLDVLAQFHERAKRGDTRNLALHNLSDLVL